MHIYQHARTHAHNIRKRVVALLVLRCLLTHHPRHLDALTRAPYNFPLDSIRYYHRRFHAWGWITCQHRPVCASVAELEARVMVC